MDTRNLSLWSVNDHKPQITQAIFVSGKLNIQTLKPSKTNDQQLLFILA